MGEILKLISETSIPTILVVAGVAFIFLSFADKVSGQFTISEHRKLHAFLAGVVLVVAGVGFNLLEGGDQSEIGRSAETKGVRQFAPNALASPGFDCDAYSLKSRAERTPQGDVLCLFETVAKADREMADHYRALREASPAFERPTLIAAQRDWIARRDVSCRASWDDLENDGITRQLVHCLENETRTRTVQLKEALAARSEGIPALAKSLPGP